MLAKKTVLLCLVLIGSTTILGLAKAKFEQKLPTEALIECTGHTIQLEVARTLKQQERGLMFRKSLPLDHGMLFIFNPPVDNIAFWMKNTYIPIDMIFLRNGKIKKIIVNVQPCTKKECPTYGTQTEVDQVIELKGGQSSKLGLKIDNTLEIKYIK